MVGKPVNTRAKPGQPFGRQAVWEAIRSLGKSFALDDLAKATGQDADTIRTYLTSLHRGGYVAPYGTRPPRAGMTGNPTGRQINVTLWALIRDIGSEAPRLRRDGTEVPATARDHMWRAMRMLKGAWTYRDLAFASSTEALAVSEVDAKDYCKHLLGAGYLMVVQPAHLGGKSGVKNVSDAKPALLRFVPSRNTGPRPPMVQRLKTVFDPNLGKIVHQEAPHDD